MDKAHERKRERQRDRERIVDIMNDSAFSVAVGLVFHLKITNIANSTFNNVGRGNFLTRVFACSLIRFNDSSFKMVCVRVCV